MPENKTNENLEMKRRVSLSGINSVYGSERDIRTLLESRSADRFKLDRDEIKKMIDDAGVGSGTNRAIEASVRAYSTEPIYSEIIDYLSNIYLWRYYYLPVDILSFTEKDRDKKLYAQMYAAMGEIVDGLNIEVTYPMILTKLFTEGIVYLISDIDSSTNAVYTIMLDPKYCRPVMMTQFGTGVFQFDLNYFSTFRTESKREEILNSFPKMFKKAYEEYIVDKTKRYLIVDGRFSTYIRLNEFNFPTNLRILEGIKDLHSHREIELERSASLLEKIVTHRIPVHDGMPLFEIDEVKDLHKDMASVVNKGSKVNLLTTFGETNVLALQQANQVQNEVLTKASEVIYQTGGLNLSLFSGANTQAIITSLARDASIVWKHVQQLTNFYNLSVNNLYNFKDYQVEIVMLPVTHYSLQKDMELYRRNAEFGVGKLELIVASGTKQKHIDHKARLEEFLKLEDILKPLKSSHTQTKEDSKTEQEKVIEKESIEDTSESENSGE